MVNGPRILDSPLARHLKILSPLVAPVKFLKEPHYGLTRFPERSHRRSHERRYRGGRSYREFERQLEARRLAEDDPETLRALRRGCRSSGWPFGYISAAPKTRRPNSFLELKPTPVSLRHLRRKPGELTVDSSFDPGCGLTLSM